MCYKCVITRLHVKETKALIVGTLRILHHSGFKLWIFLAKSSLYKVATSCLQKYTQIYITENSYKS